MENQDQSTQRTILSAAIECVNRWGLDRFSMADLAKQANMSRSTVYMYFKTRDEVIRAALLQLAYRFGEKIFLYQQQFSSPEERLIETVFYCVHTLPEEPFLSMVSSSALSNMVREHTLTTAEGMDIGTALISEMLNKPDLGQQEIREMSEFVVRFVLSLITMDSPLIQTDHQLKGFIARRLLPSLSLDVPAQYQQMGVKTN